MIMAERLKHPANRREFLAKVLRGGALGLLAAGVTAGALKRQRLLREGACVNRGVCRGCEVFEGCGLPAALSAKEVLGGR